MKFLTIDDSKLFRNMLKSIVSRCVRDYEMYEAPDGKVGLEILENNHDIKIVFVDWNMPIMNGSEFVKLARANEQFNDIVIIMVTAEGERDQIIEMAKQGVNGYVVKPFTHETIETLIKKHIQQDH